jgi:chromosome partitioning protein
MRVIAIMNQKGGVGKTTTTLNLAHALSMTGKRVMAIDLDPQAHLTASFGVDTRNHAGMDEVLMSDTKLSDVKVKVRDNIHLVPAGPALAEFDQFKDGGSKRGWALKDIMSRARGQDMVLIDCPPSAGLLTMNALLAAKEMLIPVSGDYLALHGLSRLMGILKNIETRLQRTTKKWVVVTRFHERRRLAKDVRDKLLQYFPGQVLATPIRESVALAESPSFAQSIFEYKRNSNGAQDYSDLANDLLSGRTYK